MTEPHGRKTQREHSAGTPARVLQPLHDRGFNRLCATDVAERAGVPPRAFAPFPTSALLKTRRTAEADGTSEAR